MEKLKKIVKNKYDERQKRDIWEDSEWKHISCLENDSVGKVGELFLLELCQDAGLDVSIDGLKTKQIGGGHGDGFIQGYSVEIKTARLGTTTESFQHELGETTWKADFMIFIDIAPHTFYITIFPNFNEEQYKSSCKCEPYFPSRSFCWRKKVGAFKFDTTLALCEKMSRISKFEEKYTFKWCNETSIENFGEFVLKVIAKKEHL